MRRWSVVLSAVAICTSAATVVAGNASAGNDNDPYTLSDGHANVMGGIVPVRGDAHSARPGGGSNPNLLPHNGPVMSDGAAVTTIFWGTKWGNTTFAADKVTGLETFYRGLDRSPYMGTNTEYADPSAHHVSSVVSYDGFIGDTSAAPSRAPSTGDILGEVQRKISNPVANGYYPVYVDTPRRNTGYCAWHSSGLVKGVTVQFAFFFNLDGDAGCDPNAPTSPSGHSQGLSALANVSGHELSEAATDPHLNAWYDSQGNENADKCAWTFGGSLVQLGGTDAAHSWKIQGNWSNAAYTANSGYVYGTSKVRGCIDGNSPVVTN